jgi:hypothetical protein
MTSWAWLLKPIILATQEAEIWRIMVQGQPRHKTRSCLKNNQKAKRVRDLSRVVGCLPSKHQDLGSNPSATLCVCMCVCMCVCICERERERTRTVPNTTHSKGPYEINITYIVQWNHSTGWWPIRNSALWYQVPCCSPLGSTIMGLDSFKDDIYLDLITEVLVVQ